MAMVQVGQLILRGPNGEFLPDPTPIYREIPDEDIDPETGFTKTQEKCCREFAQYAIGFFKQYVDECKKAGLDPNI